MTLEAPSSAPAHSRGRTLAIGFGTTVAMWAVAYVAMMEPGLVVGEFLFVLTLACLVAGGFVAGRTLAPGERAWLTGTKISFVSATLNLLLIGSLIGGESSREKLMNAPIWAIGAYGVSIALVVAGAVAGALTRSVRSIAQNQVRNWYNIFICIAAGTVFLLLITGGLVTGLQAGLAVPDWPNSFGHNMLLYPLSEMVGGVYYEHAHRLYGMLVGVTAIVVAATMFRFDQRRWMRMLAVAYLLAVCVQGVLGGTRVTETSTALAIVHGMFGQIVFATIVCMAAFTSTTWKSPRPATLKPNAGFDRTYSTALVILLVVQLGLGALYRHLQRDLGNPPEPMHVLFSHILVAVIVTLLVIFVAGRAWGMHRDQPVLPALGRILLLLLCVQLVLGTSATVVVWLSTPGRTPVYELVITTAHQITGAMLLATAALLMFWTRRLLAVEASPAPSAAAHNPRHAAG